MHLGGISLECQWWLFFPFAPIFCDGKNYSPPWQISIGSICKEQECTEQNKQRELSICKAQLDTAWWFELCSCSSHQSLLIYGQSKSTVCIHRERLQFCRKFLQMLSCCFALVSPHRPSKICNTDLQNAVAQRRKTSFINTFICLTGGSTKHLLDESWPALFSVAKKINK